jgi:HlyD family secretion protein
MNKSKLRRLVAILLILAAAAGAGYGLLWRKPQNDKILRLYGNIDIREVQLAFNVNERIVKILVQEGDFVHVGQLLAELQAVRYADTVRQAEKQVENQKQVLTRLLNGSRPEEILATQAKMQAAEATFTNAEITFRRTKELTERGLIAKQDFDNAEATLKLARGDFDNAKQQYVLAVKGPRSEDIEAARALLGSQEAALALAQHNLRDTRLYAPSDGMIEDRILQPGDMASPGTPVFTLAIMDPLWVRAYVPEADLGKIHLGMRAQVTTDSFPGKIYQGWVGYISPAAEFTPKTVETPELRTRLVYQVRVYVCNPENQLRLGMPATVTIILDQPASAPGEISRLGCRNVESQRQ